MGDLDGDGSLEVVVAAERLYVLGAGGAEEWSIELPGYATRGPVLFDYDGDGLPDVLVACDGPTLQVLSGRDGATLFGRAFAPAAGFDFHPAIADLDGDGRNDVFAVFGRGQSDTPTENWGRAVAMTLGGTDAGWPTYSHDHHHSGNYGYPVGSAVNRPTVVASATATGVAPPTATPPFARTPTATARRALLPRVER